MRGNDKKLWNRMSGIYDVFMKKDKNLYEEIAIGITTDVDPKGKILEIGTATGNIALLLADKIERVEAIDYVVCRIAKKMEVVSVK
ncbi:class I SAM-dependent methyltransferase [Clostridium sp. DL1XJH146]